MSSEQNSEAGAFEAVEAGTFEAVVSNVSRVIQGNDLAIRHAVTCLVAGGHLLIEDVPGVGKTSLGKALAASVSCTHRRIQFTSDLLPSDVTGVNVFDRQTNLFEFRPGPIFANVVLSDEINRTPPKTQSALLEAMEEQQVTVDGVTYELPSPFMVVATQNPIEHEGTYPLPVSQLDRFFMRIRLGYPDPADEVDMLERHGADEPLDLLRPVCSTEEILALAGKVTRVHCSVAVQRYIVDIANATRSHASVLLGMSPRAALALQRAARSWAVLRGRDFVTPDDVKAIAVPVLGHRLELRSARASSSDHVAAIVTEILARIPVLEGTPARR